ncbi:innexin inx2 [Procambarus clarkii]|uniref:innexin inx2 n=1 Tax=Procambarus clarkii TaxID=6728 RepID=UPI001E67771F|nr:innexin inx2-like [Procambarus clarkii]
MVFKAISTIKIKVEVKPVVDNTIFRLHYRYTYTIYMVCMLLCTLYDAIGDKINCISGIDSDAFNDVVNNYCFIMGTFTVDRLHGVKMGVDAPHPGVGPQQSEEPITFHTYYQWVPFVLFVQGVMFYVPHWLWKSREGGLFKQVIQDLSVRDYLGHNLDNYFNREKGFEALSKYINHHMDSHKNWAYSFFFCEFLNLAVVISTLFFTDWFLGDEFLTYGVKVFGMIGMDPENRTDPMSYVFPRMAKCTFRSFGASGTIQIRDVMCLIATNIINEKIYVFLWVWLVLLTTATSMYLVFRLLTLLVPAFRRFLLQLLVKPQMQADVATVMQQTSLSDWFLIYNLGRNMETNVFSEFIHYFAGDLSNSTDTLPMDEDKIMPL